MLIVSGLYGLLMPEELIQRYECDAASQPDVVDCRTANDRLTRVLLDYINTCGITKIFEFMSLDSYRRLISWEMIRNETRANVLHAFSDRSAGDKLLMPFGQVANKFLAAADDALLNMRPGHSEAVIKHGVNVLFERLPVPESQAVRVEKRQVTVRLQDADRIGRMRRNMIRILDGMAGSREHHDGFAARVKAMRDDGPLKADLAEAMLRFGNLRNRIEYKDHDPQPEELQAVRDGYASLEQWALKEHYIDSRHLE